MFLNLHHLTEDFVLLLLSGLLLFLSFLRISFLSWLAFSGLSLGSVTLNSFKFISRVASYCALSFIELFEAVHRHHTFSFVISLSHLSDLMSGNTSALILSEDIRGT